jgi:hypothetical protein
LAQILLPAGIIGHVARAFAGEVETGSPSENAITQRKREQSPIPSKRDSLQSEARYY